MIQVQYKQHTRTTKDETSTIQVLDNMIQVQYKQYTSTINSRYLHLVNTKKPRVHNELRAFVKWRRPTLPRVCSTIGAVGLNFSVRNGKRWNPVAITTGNIS